MLPLPVKDALKKLAGQGAQFDLIFLDPPYGRGLAEATLTVLAGSGLAAPGGWVVAEHSHRESLPERLEGLALLQNRRYGDTRVAFYLAGEKSPAEEQRG